MKVLYTLAFCTLFSVQFAYSQVQPLPATPPPPPTPLPILLETGGLPGIGTTLNQDYNCVGINPANLGMVQNGPPVITFGFAGLDARLATNSVGFSTLKEFFSDSIPYQQALADGFANRGVTLSLNIMDFGASVQIPKIGGFAFTVEDRILLNIYMNPLFANVGFNGYNSNYFNSIISDSSNDKIGIANSPQSVLNAFNGSYVKGSYTRSYAISYGREILNIGNNVDLYAGGSLEYVAGYAYADGYTTSNGVTAELAYSNTFTSLGDSNSKTSPASVAISGPTAVAHAEGLDLGGTVVINKTIRASLSITDLGLSDFTWSGTNGVTDQVINSPVDSFKNYKGAASLLKSTIGSSIIIQHQVSFTSPLPTQLHLGGSIFLIKKFVVAADIDAPLNSAGGNLEQPVTTLSGGYCIDGFRVTLGFQNSAYAPLTIPLGIVVGAGKNAVWQWGISYADLLNFFRTNSVALGGSFFFLRFRV
jgi:hypothetical protein